MPTGYTSDIYEGKEVSGKDFLIKCARAFGACIMMRDDSLDAPIPEEFKPNTYYSESLETAKKELKKFQYMTIEEAKDIIEKRYKDKIAENKKIRKERTEMKNRYLNTLADVYAWQPPTKDHIELKKYAIQQLEDSIKWDCGSDLDEYYSLDVEKELPQAYIDSQIKSCFHDIQYYSEEQEKENKRVAGRNKWIKDLRESLEKL